MPFQTRHDREICEGLRASCRQQCSEGGVADALGAGQWCHLAWGASDDATVEHSVRFGIGRDYRAVPGGAELERAESAFQVWFFLSVRVINFATLKL